MRLNGWILDLYPCPDGMVIWLIELSRKRHRLIDRSFRPCFYVEGPEARLSRLAQALEARAPVTCTFTEKTSVWDGGPLRVLEVAVHQPPTFAALARFVRRFDLALKLYNSDLMLASVYCWERNVFPLAKVEVEADTAGRILSLNCDDNEWAIDYDLPPLKMMQVRLEGLPQVNPRHGRRGAIKVEIDGKWQVLDDSDQPAVLPFERLLRTHDPDVIVTEWGDAVLFPSLLSQARQCKIQLSLNRDASPVQRSCARSYMSYGRILHIRHVYLDLDENGVKSLAMIENSPCVPRPSYVITSSPGKFQVIWKVKDMTQEQAESLQRQMVQEFGADPAATDSSRVLRLPGFVNKKYAEAFRVVAEPCSRETYRFQDFKLSHTASEHHALAAAGTASPQSSLAARTQSERDWKWAVRHVQQGESLEHVIQTLAAYRDDKANPEYYARRTVTRAYVKVALSEGANPEDVVRTISAHPPRVGMNGEQYARATVEEFQAKLGRSNQQDFARPGAAVEHRHAQQLGLGVMPS